MKSLKVHPNTKKPITSLLLAVMLLNMVFSVLASAQNSKVSDLALMCTSSGWVTVPLTTGETQAKETDLALPDLASTAHCPYCQAFEFTPSTPKLDLVHVAPSTNVPVDLTEQQIMVDHCALPQPNPHRGPPIFYT